MDTEEYYGDEDLDYEDSNFQTVSLRPALLGLHPYILIELDATGDDVNIKLGGNVSELLYIVDSFPQIRKGLKQELKEQKKEGK